MSEQQPSRSGLSSLSYLPGLLTPFPSLRYWGDPSKGSSPLLPPCLGSPKSLEPKARATPALEPWPKISRQVFPWSVVTGCVCACV